MNEPIDTEFHEINSSNLPVLRSTIPQNAAGSKQFNDDRDKYPIENHLWAVQNDRLMCLGLINSYYYSPRYRENFNIRGYSLPGRENPAKIEIELSIDKNQQKNIETVRNIFSDDRYLTRSNYLTHIMGSVVYPSLNISYGFLMYEMLMEELEYNICSNISKTIVTFVEAGGPSINFYDFDTETHTLNKTYKIQPPQQKLLR